MSVEHLFDVVFEGRPLQDVSIKKAIDGLAALARKQPDDIAHLFNESPTVLKRGVTRETALKYCQVLKKKGLACHIANASLSIDSEKIKKTSGPNINSLSNPLPNTYHDPVSKVHVQQECTDRKKIENKKPYFFSFPEYGWIVNIVTLSFLLPETIQLETSPAELPSATIGQRIWSAVSTFFHGIFMGYVMAFPVGLVAGLYLLFSISDITDSTIEALRGGSILIGIVTSFLLLPLLWRGHSFGQRAMGILVVPDLCEDMDELNGLTIMVRRLTLRSKCLSAKSMSSRPWNSALTPFAAAIVLHLVLIPISGAFLWITHSFNDNTSENTAYNHQVSKIPQHVRHTLHQIDPVIRSYNIEFGVAGPTPLNRSVFEKILNHYLSDGITGGLLEKLDNGTLKLKGDTFEYQIGIYEDGIWSVLNERGEISQEKDF